MRELFADSLITSVYAVLWVQCWSHFGLRRDFTPPCERQTGGLILSSHPGLCPLWCKCESLFLCVNVCEEGAWTRGSGSCPPPLWRSLVPQMVCCCRGERTGPPLFNAAALWRPAPFHLPFSSGCSTTNQGWCERGEKHKRNRGKCRPAGLGRDGAGVGEFIATGQLSRLLVCLSGSFICLSLQ